ncbi:hypothetical protein OKA05_25550 [Luteolibacter arcticus]|uniref:HEAT repeat domain-containing protein n=1 Tax=Luteolibacter arcticus TaxID=1581411 RepID=A0ABT3GR20_9BACT|nr:hypothetical protein [Luteolibacter arcticus]MCW1925950.1 hypothetical protein [Luteolibacter arcticus]
MDQPHADAEKLSIRCPGCGQRFKVGLELRDRMVECGTCEHRFRVNDEVVVRAKKFYPGERRVPSLDSFARVPKSVAAPSHSTFQTVQYAPEPVHHPIEATSPLRLLLGFSAVLIAVIVALLLIFGGSPGGVLYGTGQSKRLMLAGFSALVCGVLLIAANPRARGRAVVGALAAAAGLLSLPFVFTTGSETGGPVTESDRPSDGSPIAVAPPSSRNEAVEALKKEIVYEPMERALESDPNAIGIWLHGLREFHRLQVRDYIVRNSGASPSSHMYPRSGDYLMVVTGVKEDLSVLARLCERFGEVRRPSEELRIIEVVVRNDSFQEGPLDKLTDPANPAFYELNKRELESIDLERARRAVNRLAPVEPKLYRKDIVKRMGELVQEGDAAIRFEIGKALPKWSEPGDGMEAIVRGVIEKIPPGEDVAQSLVTFLAIRNDQAAIPLVDQLWLLEPNKWEQSYGELGTGIEDKLLARFPETTVTQRMSAVRLLDKVGTAKSVPVLEGARAEADPEMKMLIERALESIGKRK